MSKFLTKRNFHILSDSGSNSYPEWSQFLRYENTNIIVFNSSLIGSEVIISFVLLSPYGLVGKIKRLTTH